MRLWRFLLVFVSVAAYASTPAALHSPWDQNQPRLSGAPYACGEPITLAPDMMIGTLHDKQRPLSDEVQRAAYAESRTALDDFVKRTVRAADNFRQTGSREAAACAIDLLSQAASQGALTGYLSTEKKLYYQNEAVRSAAIAYLKVRGAQTATPEQTSVILQWMKAIVLEERHIYEHDPCGRGTCPLQSHRGLDTAAAAFAVGIAANDDGLVHWAISRYHAGIKQIDGRGMLHYDMKGEFALGENLDSATALVQMAEFGEINGIAMYGYQGGRIHLLVHTVALGLVDPTLYGKFARRKQTIPHTLLPWEVCWASVYDRRFPDPVMTALLHQAGPGGNDMWGGRPWDEQS